MDRNNLSFRKNCEGYFICSDGRIIARDSIGYLEFPGGGINNDEKPNDAIIREAYEEAGVILESEPKLINKMKFIWSSKWPKTDKQKKRYQQYRGEEMYFFFGKVKNLVKSKGDIEEAGWGDNKLMSIKDAINILNNYKPFEKEMEKYRNYQLKVLKSLEKNKILF